MSASTALEIYSKYVDKYGYPPKQPNHLISFAKQIGRSISYKDARNIIKNPSNDQSNDAKQAIHKYPKVVSSKSHNRNKSLIKKKNTIYYKYNGNTFMMITDKDKYTVGDLKKDALLKINEPSHLLIFKLESEIVHDYSMDIMKYFKAYNKNSIIFEIELIDPSKQIGKSDKKMKQIYAESQGNNVKKLIKEIQQQFKSAYYTKDNDDAKKKNNDDAKKNDNDDSKPKTKNMGKWDKNLNEGISTVISSQENKAFNEIIKQFENQINNKLDEHKQLDDKVINSDKHQVKQELNTLMNLKKNKIEQRYNATLKRMEERYKTSNKLWEETQTETLKNNNYVETIKEKIERERIKRQQYQQRIIKNIKREYQREQAVINNVHNEQESKLLSCNNAKEWHNAFKKEEINKEKINTLQEMVINKIQTTKTQITFAKYLNNSPFADDLKQKAKELDHEITKIAALADEPLLVDAVNREIVDGNDEKQEDEQKTDDKYLEFELRFDDSYSSYNSLKQLEIKKNLATLIGINGQQLEFVSSREGCIICKFKAKMESVYQKAVQIGTGVVAGIQRGAEYGHKEMKKEVKSLTEKIFEGTWAKKVDECVSFLQSRLGAIKTNKDALYLATKCVAVIVSQFTEDKNKSVLDGDFLKDDKEKEYHKVIMDPKWDKEYGQGKTYWKDAIDDGRDRGGYPYYCPTGWKRYGIRVDNFKEKYTGWSVCYHGSETFYIGSILSHGIFGTQDQQQRFFSPSIEYSAYPRYACPKKMKNGKYIQTIFQCRINSDPTIMRKKGSTSGGGHTIIDPNFSKDIQNTAIEWYLEEPNLDQYVVYGIMVRISDDPTKLPSSHWWGCNLEQLKSYYPLIDK